jgi:pimeloyl-ACP methyl ester carboxylesterase
MQITKKPAGLRIGCLAAVILLSGCGSIKIAPCSSEKWQEKNAEVSFNDSELSNFSRNILIRNYLLDDVEENPEKAIDLLERLYRSSGEIAYLRVLTEVCFQVGNDADDENRKVALHAAACYFSYRYLQNQHRQPRESRYSPDFFIIGRYYNAALATVFTYLKQRNLLLSDGFSLPAVAGTRLRFEAPLCALPFPGSRHLEMLLCRNFIVTGLQTYSYSYGLGLPLIVNEPDPPVQKPFKPIEEMIYPATVFMRLSEKNERGEIAARLEFYDTLQQETADIDGVDIPLELDYSTPIAYLLRKPPVMDGIKYLFSPGQADKLNGLYWLTPLSKRKIPVVLVHGLLSNPRTWAQMVNTLLGDPRIRQHYQFWLFSYATGNPVPYSAHLLRKALREAKPGFTDGGEPSFNRMVIIAHSMGGLLAKTTIQTSGNLIEKFTEDKADEIEKKLTVEQQQFLREIMFFEKLLFVRRVIFLAVPHRGSDLAARPIIGRISAQIALPGSIVERIRQISDRVRIKADPQNGEQPFRIATGLENLAPDNKALNLLDELQLDRDTPYHTLCGNREEAGVPGGTDGVVPYSSSHLNEARSETIVKSGHAVQENAMAIEEVRRLLLLHLRENGLLEK